jgi:hypothetical protein
VSSEFNVSIGRRSSLFGRMCVQSQRGESKHGETEFANRVLNCAIISYY